MPRSYCSATAKWVGLVMTTEAFGTTYEVSRATLPTGEYRQISGNTALSYGIIAAGQLAGVAHLLRNDRSGTYHGAGIYRGSRILGKRGQREANTGEDDESPER